MQSAPILFQFHKGTIRTRSKRPDEDMDYNFNSIKVRLEQSVAPSLGFGAIVFQFHKGTIRTVSAEPGTNFFCYFNSIKVRLERRRSEALCA